MNSYPAADATVDRTPTVTYNVVGTGPFRVERDGDHGTYRIVNANGTPAKVTIANAAVAGFSGAVSEATNVTFAGTDTGRELAEAIVAAENA